MIDWKDLNKNTLEISKPTSAERVAGYIVRFAKLAEFYTKLYLNHGVNDSANWTEEETICYDNFADEVDPYWFALNETERKFVEDKIIPTLSLFCNGKWNDYLDKLNLLK